MSESKEQFKDNISNEGSSPKTTKKTKYHAFRSDDDDSSGPDEVDAR